MSDPDAEQVGDGLGQRRRQAVDEAGGTGQQAGAGPGGATVGQQHQGAGGETGEGAQLRPRVHVSGPPAGRGDHEEDRQSGHDEHRADPVLPLHPGAFQPGAERQGEQQAADEQGLHQHQRGVPESDELQQVGQPVADDPDHEQRAAQEAGQQPEPQRLIRGFGSGRVVLQH